MLSPGVQVEIEERGEKRVFNTAAEARDFVLGRPMGMVLKADGLAAGKGVYVCDNLRQALEAIDQIMVRRIFGQAGDRLIIEERLDGQEASVLATHRRPHDHPPGIEPGLQACLRPRRRAQYRRHGGLLTKRRHDPRADGAGRARNPGPGDPRLETSQAPVSRRPLRRTHAHQPGAQGPRVQRPVRRPGDPGRAHAPEIRPARCAGSRRRRPAGYRRLSTGTRGPR